jgi:hypothetical protein
MTEERALTDRPEGVEKPQFMCSVCSFKCNYEVFGRKSKLSGNLTFLEDVYMLRDPLRALDVEDGGRSGDGRHVRPGFRWPLILGANCSVCKKPVCMAKACSTFRDCSRVCARCAAGGSG